MKSILVLTMYGDLAASSRQRCIQYFDALNEHNFNIRVEPLFPNDYLKKIFKNTKPSYLKILWWYIKRFYILSRSSKYDILWVQYELFPQLPSFFETLVLFFNKNIILDFDDAIFHKYDLWSGKFRRLFLEKKLEPLCSKASAIICGNNYIKEWAKKLCKNSILIPTVINFEKYNSYKSLNKNYVPTIGWIGSPATWLYVEPLLDMLSDLSKKNNFKVLIIGSGCSNIKKANFEFREWNEESEIEDIYQMDVGIMPLFNDPWTLGKCGYKLIQYMACQKPVIASPVGVNCNIVEDGVNGFFASTTAEWKKAINFLISDKNLREEMGNAGSIKIKNNYSLNSQLPVLLELFSSLDID
tara:strand:- start:8138 stop:9205 length:1068 start_codon:yes stop_codon:yes gene_type:complete